MKDVKHFIALVMKSSPQNQHLLERNHQFYLISKYGVVVDTLPAFFAVTS